MRRPGLVLACGLLLVTNVVVLLGVAYNRRGEPDSTVVMTERELRIGGDWQKENTGMWLILMTGGMDSWRSEGPGWFDQKKLEELGFDCSVPPADPGAELFYEKALPLRRYAAMEYDGDAWKEWIARREQELLNPKSGTYESQSLEERRKLLEAERAGHSRLFVVDVARGRDALRQRYPDRSRVMVAEALVRLQLNRRWDETTKTWKEAYLAGNVSEILISSIHVPLDKRKVLDDVRLEQQKPGNQNAWIYSGYTGYMQEPPRYEVDLKYGRRLEPWVEAIRRIAPPPAPAP